MKKRFFIFQQREWHNRIGYFLAENFKKDGFELGCLSFKKNVHKKIQQNYQNLYEIIINHDDVIENPLKYIPKDKRDLNVKEIIEDLEIESMWQLTQSARHHSKSYKKKFYYSFEQNKTDDEIIIYFKALYYTAKKVYDEFKPDIILAPNFVSLPHAIFNLFFKRRNTMMIGTTDCKVAGKEIFTYDYLDRDSNFLRLLNQLNKKDKIEYDLRSVDEVISNSKDKKYRKIYFKMTKDYLYFPNIKKFLKRFLRDLYFSITKQRNNHIKGLGPTPDDRPFLIVVRDFVVFIKNTILEKRMQYHDLSEIKNFVYFPLQVQPESATDLLSPLSTNQIETARQISLQLPPDFTLVVKDHPAMYGLRSYKYLRKMLKTPNIKLINFRHETTDVLNKSSLLITATGSTIFEAAVLKKPCLQLGELGTTLKLPNVIKRDTNLSLDKQIKDTLKMNIKERYEFYLRNFVYAGLKIGFEPDYRLIWEANKKGDLKKIYKVFFDEVKKLLA